MVSDMAVCGACACASIRHRMMYVVHDMTCIYSSPMCPLLGSHLGGVHFELTGENVTECVGGPQNLLEKNLSLRYTTYCDPRMNYLQSMEVRTNTLLCSC